MRRAGSGSVIQVSSAAGALGLAPVGADSASKFALEEAAPQEVAARSADG